MAENTVMEFTELTNRGEELQNKVDASMKSGSDNGVLGTVLNEKDYAASAEDFEEAMSELSDDEVKNAAGGSIHLGRDGQPRVPKGKIR